MGKPEYPGGKPIDRMQCKAYDINLDEGFTAIIAQENNNKNNNNKKQREREGERERETHTYTLTQSYMRIYVLMQYYGKLQ